MNHSTRFLICALGIGLVMRAVLFFIVSQDASLLTHHDQIQYLSIAAAMTGEWNFGAWMGGERMPVYPVFLAVCHVLTGAGPVLDGELPFRTLQTAVVIQNMIGLSTVYIMYKTGRLFSQNTANLCAGFAAINLNMAVYSNQMLTESLFYPLMALALHLLLLYRMRGGNVILACLAAVLGFGTLIRSVNMYLPLFVLPCLLLEPGRWGIKERLKKVAVFSVLFFLFVLPWMGRNLYLYGHPALTNQGAAHIVGWVLPAVGQYEEGLNYDQARKVFADRWQERLSTMDEGLRGDSFARAAEAKSYFKEYVKEVAPQSVAKAWFWGAVKNVFTPVSVELGYVLDMDWTHFSETPGESFPEQAYNFIVNNKNKTYAAMMLAGIAATLLFRFVQTWGFIVLLRKKPGALVACLVIVGYYLAVSGPVGYAKYRLPYEALFVLLTALAVAGLPCFRDKDAECNDAF